jgi:Tfp pilus assembly PilM family ATPase
VARFLAIDYDPAGPLVASATVGRGGIKLERVLAWPDGDPPPTAPAALGARLRELLKENRVAAAPVLVCLPRDKVVLKDVRYPKAPPQQEPLVVKFQAKKELAAAESDVLMDYLPIPAPSGADDCRATVVFVNKHVYADLMVMCDAAGLKLAAVTPRSFAVAAAYRRAVASAAAHPPDDPAGAVAVLSLADRGGEFTVVHGKQVPFTRSVPAAAVTGEAALVGELKRSLAMYATQYPGAAVQAIYLTEGSVAGRSWSGRLQTALPIPVYPFDPTAGAGNAADLPEMSRGRFVGAVGLLAARAESDILPINFVTPRAPKAEPSKARTGIFLGVLALILLLAVGGGFGYVIKKRKAAEVARLQSELTDISGDIDAALPDKKRLAAVDDFLARRVANPDLLYDIFVEFPIIDPDKMQLIEFSTKPQKTPASARGSGGPGPKGPLPPGGPRGGLAAAVLKPEDRPVAELTLVLLVKNPDDLVKFKDTLQKEKHFGKITSAIKGSVTGAGDRTQYELTLDVLRWPARDFSRVLVAKFPEKPKPLPVDPAGEPATPDPDPGFDPFNPGFDPFNPDGSTP